MHFRIRKNVVQLVRNTYDPETKKSVATVVARMPLAKPALTGEMRKVLTPQECIQTQDWIDSRHRVVALRAELAVLELPAHLEMAAEWIESNARSPAAMQIAPRIVQSWQKLRQQLKRAGLID